MSFLQLPPNILQSVFCYLPLSDLLLNCSQVCRAWNAIIMEDSFFKWKKRYNMLKVKVGGISEEVKNLAESIGMDSLGSCLPKLIVYMHSFHLEHTKETILFLEDHEHYSSAVLLIKKIPELKQKSIGAVVAALVIISPTVGDVYDILKYLTKGSCPVYRIAEAMYCILTFLLYTKRTYEVGYGLHYRLCSALHLFENWILAGSNLNLSNDAHCRPQPHSENKIDIHTKLQFTDEQKVIVNHKLQLHDVILISGFAGSGKTVTVAELTKQNPNLRFLVVTFNCGVTKNLYPTNVEFLKLHPLALKLPEYKSLTTEKYNLSDEYPLREEYKRCFIVKTLQNFISSHKPSERLNERFIPEWNLALSSLQYPSQWDLPPTKSRFYSTWQLKTEAEELYSEITVSEYSNLMSLEDFFSNLSEKEPTCYDCIIIEGVEDVTSKELDLILSQDCAKVLVGDENQRLSGFRGTHYVFNDIVARSTHVYNLSRSFRFCSSIAYMASLALDILEGDDRKMLFGGTQKSFVTGYRSDSAVRAHTGQVLVLSRSKYSLVREAFRIFCEQSHNDNSFEKIAFDTDSFEDLTFEFVGCIEDYDPDYYIGHFMLRQFPGGIELLKNKCRKNDFQSDIVFSTVSNAKGLEFDTVYYLCVQVSHCNPVVFNFDSNKEKVIKRNNLYLAITRARKRLIMSTAVYTLLQKAHDKFLFPVVCLDDRPTSACCVECRETYTTNPKSLQLYRLALELVSHEPQTRGYLCRRCSKTFTRWDEDSGTFEMYSGLGISVAECQCNKGRVDLDEMPGYAEAIENSQLPFVEMFSKLMD